VSEKIYFTKLNKSYLPRRDGLRGATLGRADPAPRLGRAGPGHRRRRGGRRPGVRAVGPIFASMDFCPVNRGARGLMSSFESLAPIPRTPFFTSPLLHSFSLSAYLYRSSSRKGEKTLLQKAKCEGARECEGLLVGKLEERPPTKKRGPEI
jgi:hypothetical protein